MKRTLAIALLLALMLSLCACGSKAAPAATEAPAPAATQAPAPAVTEAPAPAATEAPAAAPAIVEDSANVQIGEQIAFLAARFEDLRQKEAGSPWYYAVTDLDHNGRLELLATSKMTGGASALKAWEISPNGSSMIICTMQTISAPPGSDIEDLHVDSMYLNLRSDSIDTYYDKDAGVYYYTVVDVVEANHFYIPGREVSEANWVDGNGIAVTTNVNAVSMTNGSIDPGFLLGSCVSYSVNGSDPQSLCRNAKGEQITMDEFLAIGQSSFPGLTSFNTAFDWFTADEALTLGRFVDSYATFDGVRDPDHPESGVKLLASQSSGGVYITKNPSDEKQNDGGTAEFVADANVFDSVTWTFIAPDGKTYNDQEFVSTCGGIVDGANASTLKIFNVNDAMNAWGVFATFDYRESSARTTTAYLYVWGESMGSRAKLDEFYAEKPYLNGGAWACPMCGAEAHGSQCYACGFNPVAYYAIYQGSNPTSYGWYYGVNPQTPINTLPSTSLSSSFSWNCPRCGYLNQDVMYCRNCNYHYGDPVGTTTGTGSGISSSSIASNTAREAAQGATLIKCQYCGNFFNGDYDVCPYCHNAPDNGTLYAAVPTGSPVSSSNNAYWNTVQEMYQGATLRKCQYCGNFFNEDYDVCPYCHGEPNDSYQGSYYNSTPNYYDSSVDYSSYNNSSSGGSRPDGSFDGYTPGGNPRFIRHDSEGNEYNTVFCPVCGLEHSMATNCPNCGSGYT